MAVSFQRDDAARRITVVVTGPLHAAEILSIVDWQADEGLWHYGCLYDERQVTVSPSVADVAPIARYMQQLDASLGPRGPVAVVVSAHGGSVDIYTRLSTHIGLGFQVFDNVGDAERWLEQHAQTTVKPRDWQPPTYSSDN